ncbi:MAG: glycosyltransferase family 4 protein, partial [Algoriphagus sp.]
IPDLKTPIKVIANGFDTDFWKDLDQKRQPKSFISVATGTSNPARARVKGYDLIEQLAANHPDWSFTLAGDATYTSPNPNVKIIGKQAASQLRELYNSHEFYLQLSTSEGFPNALGEAMACGCVPIGSAVGAIPEIIGSEELILNHKNYLELEKLLLKLTEAKLLIIRQNTRQKIHSIFPFSGRKNKLLEVLKS